MTADDTLARLTAGVAEDEQMARAADVLGQIAETITTSTCEEFADHIARHNPKRTGHEVALKRLILDRHNPEKMEDGTYCDECRHTLGKSADGASWPCDYIRALEDIYTEPQETP